MTEFEEWEKQRAVHSTMFTRERRAAFEAGQRTLPLADIIKYVEDTAVQIDGEWGSVRTLEELIAEGLMPDIYTKLKEAQNES